MSALITVIAVVVLLVAMGLLGLRRAGRTLSLIVAEEAEVTRRQEAGQRGGKHRLIA